MPDAAPGASTSPAEPAAAGTHTPEDLRARVLTEAPRLGPQDTFHFACHAGLPCFNRCCADVNIFLSPYDVLRLKRRLGLTSGEFLETYTLLPVQRGMRTPVVMLRMRDDEAKRCPLLGDAGCTVYADRHWTCRMYPVGLAAQRDGPDGGGDGRFYFLLHDERCCGFGAERAWTVAQWLDGQEAGAYDAWGEAFKELTLHPFFERGGVLSPEKLHMLFTACYDLDRFRDFVFGSTLLQRFDVDDDLVEEMRGDDETLLRFAFLWLRFSLFGEPTMKARPGVLEAFKGSRAAPRPVAAPMPERGP